MFRRVLLFALLIIVMPLGCTAALDISVTATPELTIPIGTDSGLYTLGGGFSLLGEVTLFDFFAPAVEAGIQIQPLKNVGTNLVVTRAGIEANAFIYPISRLLLKGGLAFGSYVGVLPETDSFSGLYWGGHADVGFRFTPAFTLSGGAEFRQYLYSPEPIFSGLSFGLTAHVQLNALSTKSTGINIESVEERQVFPILYTKYNQIPIGTVRIINNEQAEIRNVQVYFQAGEFTSKAQLTKEIPMLRKGEAAEVPLLAVFNEEILAFTENTKIEGEVIVRYELLNAERESTRSQSISILHRNAAVWEDDQIVAAFVSPNDPAVLEFSKFVAGIVREQVRPDISENLQYGMGLFEGLRLFGVTFTPDPSTPYQDFHGTDSVDYIQYPYQTIAYKGGEQDDLGLLYMAALESIGIHAAYVPLENDFLIAVDLNMDRAAAAEMFYFHDELIYLNGSTWLPLRVSKIKEGFMLAWMEGIKTWNAKTAESGAPVMIPIVEAWGSYPSVGVSGETVNYTNPPDEMVINSFESSIYRFIKREVEPRARDLKDEMGVSATGKDYNGLGILHAKYGLLDDAKEWFIKAIREGFRPAAVNMGNLAFLQSDYAAAVKYFSMALEYRPNSRAALVGLARAKYELDVFAEADELYEQIKEIDPELADRYSYLSSHMEGSVSRASSAADRKGDMFWNEEDE